VNDVAFGDFDVLTFDCYGTLIDWETGILDALRTVFAAHRVDLVPERVLELYGDLESEAERGPYRTTRRFSARSWRVRHSARVYADGKGTGDVLDSVQDWPAFPDSPARCRRCTRSTGSPSCPTLTTTSSPILRSGSRCGSTDHHRAAGEVLQTLPETISGWRSTASVCRRTGSSTVAQSLFHDIAPANTLGLSSVWVNRRHKQEGSARRPRPRPART